MFWIFFCPSFRPVVERERVDWCRFQSIASWFSFSTFKLYLYSFSAFVHRFPRFCLFLFFVFISFLFAWRCSRISCVCAIMLFKCSCLFCCFRCYCCWYLEFFSFLISHSHERSHAASPSGSSEILPFHFIFMIWSKAAQNPFECICCPSQKKFIKFISRASAFSEHRHENDKFKR